LRRDRSAEKEIAADRIARLARFAEAEARRGKVERAGRHASLARRIAMRYQISLPRDLRQRVCKSCGTFLVPGSTARIRLRPTRVVVTCLACGAIKRLSHGIPRPPSKQKFAKGAPK
jgi:ribonuclease P protein subunit RPR2